MDMLDGINLESENVRAISHLGACMHAVLATFPLFQNQVHSLSHYSCLSYHASCLYLVLT